ncbi:MAG: Trm112 family protein [Acidobacteriota bacterium]
MAPDGQNKLNKQNKGPGIDAATMSLLACPVCRGSLRLEDEHLVCTLCARAYPIRNGIPALIAGQARP